MLRVLKSSVQGRVRYTDLIRLLGRNVGECHLVGSHLEVILFNLIEDTAVVDGAVICIAFVCHRETLHARLYYLLQLRPLGLVPVS